MDNIYMFTFRNLKLIFAGISLAILIEGLIWFFAPGKLTRWLEKISRGHLRLMGIVEIVLSLALLYLIIYR